ncbi:S-adenosyl-L-methionine-dependent methyltransferase [Morchella snyderi]|nr:S-adenosyl-L-methionine-dependent methyltransferase [Morchella snyderi]
MSSSDPVVNADTIAPEISVASSCNSDDDASSTYGTDIDGLYSTESLSSSIYEYRYENGRRYHAYKAGKYMLPNDETEQDRLDIINHVYNLIHRGKLHLAPIDPNPQNILDIGTGTGIWAIDCAEQYPSANVIGTDLSPIQPSWVPPNVSFQIDDAEQSWTFNKNHFDLIHIRNLMGGVANWEHVIDECFEHTKPGGWVHMTEYEMAIFSDDGTVTPDLQYFKFYEFVAQAAIKTGRDYQLAAKLEPLLKRSGFTNIVHKVIKCPTGMWPREKKQKEIGAYLLLSVESGFEAFGMKPFTEVLNMTEEEAKEFCGQVLSQARDKLIHGYSLHHIYYAQKPEEGC